MRELNELILSLGFDDEAVPGQTKIEKVNEFVQYVQRRSKEVQLIDRLREVRPLVNWTENNRR